MLTCILCDSDDAVDRLCGFDLCAPCHMGASFEANLARWSLELQSKTWHETHTYNGQTETISYLEARIAFPSPVDARAHFGTGPTSNHHSDLGSDAGLWQRLSDWFNPKDLEVGDPLFDDAVFISEPEGDELRRLLADEGVQTAIMELVSRGGVRLGDGWVRIRRESITTTPSLVSHGIPLALLAIHVDTFGRLTG